MTFTLPGILDPDETHEWRRLEDFQPGDYIRSVGQDDLLVLGVAPGSLVYEDDGIPKVLTAAPTTQYLAKIRKEPTTPPTAPKLNPNDPFYTLTWADLAEQLPGATDEELARVADEIGDLLSERFADLCRDIRAEREEAD